MSLADLVILVIVGLSGLIGLWWGFVRTALSFSVWLFAIWIAWTYYPKLDPLLAGMIHSDAVRLAVSAAALFVLVLVIGALLIYLLGQVVRRAGLTVTDRFLGVFFGVGWGAAFVAILVLLAGLTPLPKAPWWQDSLFMPVFVSVATWVLSFLPPEAATNFVFK